jgi:hypothetical protein
MSTINLTNAEVLDFSQTANYIDGGIYQYGRTVSLAISAFIYPGNNVESTNFGKVDKEERAHLDEILSSGFVTNINIGGQIISDVKILSYEFPTSSASLNNHINLLKVNMNLEFYEAFDQTGDLKLTDPDIYKDSPLFLKKDYAQYFSSFGENFSFSISDNYEHNFTQNISFALRQNSETEVDLVAKAKELALKAFNLTGNAMAKVGYIDSRYADFSRIVKGSGLFSESYDSLNNRYSITRTISSKNGVYKSSQKDEKWSASFTHSVQTGGDGSVSVTESGVIQGRSVENIETTTDKGQDTYENAYTGLVSIKAGAYDRCQATFATFIKDPPSWVPGDQEWNNSDNLKDKLISFGRNINRTGGQISYTISFTNNPRMHADAIFEYTIQASRQTSNITSVTESGTIRPYEESKNSEYDPKTLYDKFAASDDVIARIKPLFESVRVPSSTSNLTYPKNLTGSNISFPAYGVEISYSFTYSDDPTLRNETYVRRLEKTDDYKMPVAMRSSVVAPNIKETNYDSNQSTEGTKSVSMNCVFKRNPSSNLINSSHTNYLKTASDSVLTSLKNETQTSAFVTSLQAGKDELSWYLNGMSYNFGSDYNLSYSADMSFVDKKGVAAEALEY